MNKTLGNLNIVVSASVLVLSACNNEEEVKEDSRPNILLIMSDDMGV